MSMPSATALRSFEKTPAGCRENKTAPRLLFAATVAETVRGFLLPFAAHFRKLGWEVEAMARNIRQDSVCRASFDHVWDANWTRNPLDPRNLLCGGKIREHVESREYDIVHVHTPVASFVTRFALDDVRRGRDLRVIYTAHGFHFHPAGGALRNRVFEMLERRAGQWTDYLVVMNREDLKAAREKELIAAGRIRFMPGIGVDRSYYSPSGLREEDLRRLRRELGITQDAPVLLMLAEFIERKRHADAITAFSRLRHPEARLALAGGGPLLESMKKLASQLGVAGRVLFLGVRRDIPVLMKASRALVLPSSQEGLPRSILEALSMGLPVIGSRIRGTSELLEQGAGLLFEAGDVEGLSEAMHLMLDDPERAANMGLAGREQSARYDLAQILAQHEELYREALQI